MTRVVWRGSGLRGGSGARAAARSGRRVGVMGMDLGGVSGVAWWCGELKGGIGDTFEAQAGLENRLQKTGGCLRGYTQVECGRGSALGERAGAEALSRLWVDVCACWRDVGIGDQDMYLVVEDFILRAKVGSTSRAGLASPRLAGLVEGMCVRVCPAERFVRYGPARSKPFAPSERLKKWNLWCRSAPHARDAAKQVALHVAVLLDAG